MQPTKEKAVVEARFVESEVQAALVEQAPIHALVPIQVLAPMAAVQEVPLLEV